MNYVQFSWNLPFVIETISKLRKKILRRFLTGKVVLLSKLKFRSSLLVFSRNFIRVPVVVDLACMRDAMKELGSDSNKINPPVPVDLVIDHSVQVDVKRSENAVQANMELEFQRNKEGFAFLKWGSNAFRNPQHACCSSWYWYCTSGES
ncbi:hypothetical protein K1719_002054 [Acacia pycnantha]|nr:hypothetical protein K1719_002054 [Acacia pycnantha]